MQNKHPKVLLCCPTSDKKAYCDTDWFEMVSSLSYPNYDIFIADNSTGLQYSKKLQSKGFKVKHINNANKSFSQILAESHNACREYAVKHNYDYIFHLESDVFPDTPNIIQRLMEHNKQITCAPYHIQQGEKSVLFAQQVDKHQVLGEYHLIVNSLYPAEDLIFIDGKLKEIANGALGCVLIHKSVFSNVEFRYVKGANAYPDTYFYLDCYAKGYRVFMDTSLFCKHKNQQYTEFNQVVNPK